MPESPAPIRSTFLVVASGEMGLDLLGGGVGVSDGALASLARSLLPGCCDHAG